MALFCQLSDRVLVLNKFLLRALYLVYCSRESSPRLLCFLSIVRAVALHMLLCLLLLNRFMVSHCYARPSPRPRLLGLCSCAHRALFSYFVLRKVSLFVNNYVGRLFMRLLRSCPGLRLRPLAAVSLEASHAVPRPRVPRKLL